MGEPDNPTDDAMPWEKTTEAKLEQQEMTVVSCWNCDHTWVPQVERPKFCTNCNLRLDYVDEVEEPPEESDDETGGEDDLDSLFEEGDAE